MNNKVSSIRIIYNRYKKATSTTKASVELVITYDSKQKYISTGIMLYPNQWKKGMITNCPDAFAALPHGNDQLHGAWTDLHVRWKMKDEEQRLLSHAAFALSYLTFFVFAGDNYGIICNFAIKTIKR